MTYQELLYRVADYLNRVDMVSLCGLAEGTNANTLKTTLDANYSIAGVQYTKGVTDNIAMTALAQQAISTYCLYLVQINAAGTVSLKKGTSVATDTAVLPTADNANISMGAFKVQTNGSTTFTSGTTDLSAAGLTVTYYDIDTAHCGRFINQAIYRLEHEYSFRHMKVKTTAALAVSTSTISNPITNYKQFLAAFAQDVNGTNIPIERVSYPDAIRQFPNLTTDVGEPKIFCEVPSTETTLTPDIAPTQQILIRPTTTASDSYTLNFFGYQYSPELDGVVYTTNWWTQNAWEVVLYGALIEAEPFIKNDEKAMTWKAFYDAGLKGLKESEIIEELSGSYQEVHSNYVV